MFVTVILTSLIYKTRYMIDFGTWFLETRYMQQYI